MPSPVLSAICWGVACFAIGLAIGAARWRR